MKPLFGSSFDDVLPGTGKGDKIFAGGGNDTLFGNEGDNHLKGDAGNDTLFGGEGDDHLQGGDGNDFLDGGAGNNKLNGGDGFDTVLYDGSIFDADIKLKGDQTQITRSEGGGSTKDKLTDVEAAYFAAEDYTFYLDGRDNAVLITGDVSGTVFEDSGVAATGTLIATDFDGSDGIVAASGSTTYGDYSVDGAGIWTYVVDDADAAVNALNTGETLSDSFEVFADDGTSQTIDITIEGADDAAPPPSIILLDDGGLFCGTDGVQDNFVFNFDKIGSSIEIKNFDIGEDRLIITNMEDFGGAAARDQELLGAPAGTGFTDSLGATSLIFRAPPLSGVEGLLMLKGGLVSSIDFLDELGDPEGPGFITDLFNSGDFELGVDLLVPYETDAVTDLAADDLFVFYANDLIV